MLQALVVEDDDSFWSRFRDQVAVRHEDQVTWTRVTDGEAARAALARVVPDLLLCDLSLPPAAGDAPEDDQGERILAHAEGLPDPPHAVVLSGQDLARAIGLVGRRKVGDFVSKAAAWDEIASRVEVALAHAARARVEAAPPEGQQASKLVGAGLGPLRETLTAAARSDATVLLLGETGTGKSLAARWLHDASPRADQPFVAVACGAFPGDLVEAELFGHAAGAFTGAQQARKGRFRSADGGTLFLDEIGEVPLSTQAKLLRVLEERQVEPLGTDEAVAVDVRLVAATHRDLGAMVEQGQFREDLFYRLRVVTAVVPPLRDRLGDLEDLVPRFLPDLRPRVEGLTADAWAYLRARPWKGNVRELRTCLEAAAVHASGPRITAVALCTALGPWGAAPPPDQASGTDGAAALLGSPDFRLKDWLAEQERALVEEALRRVDGNVAEAARLLGEKPDTLRARRRRAKTTG